MPDNTRNSTSDGSSVEEPGYEELFAQFSDSAEKILLRSVAVLALLLVALQLALLVPAVRETLVRTERLEGVPFSSGSQP